MLIIRAHLPCSSVPPFLWNDIIGILINRIKLTAQMNYGKKRTPCVTVEAYTAECLTYFHFDEEKCWAENGSCCRSVSSTVLFFFHRVSSLYFHRIVIMISHRNFSTLLSCVCNVQFVSLSLSCAHTRKHTDTRINRSLVIALSSNGFQFINEKCLIRYASTNNAQY